MAGSVKHDEHPDKDEYGTHTWETFVSPSVKFKADPDTRKLIADIMPCFPKSCRVIAGYLNDDDQFWKVNYHWELLCQMLKKALDLPLSTDAKSKLVNMNQRLAANPPDPLSGYMRSKKPGEPHDRSSAQDIVARWSTMRGVKAEFRKLLDAEEIPKNYPPSERWDLAAAPVAKPGTSKHGCGYALDIHGHGKSKLIQDICASLGATLKFDEQSHVHVEFKQGVVIGGRHAADDHKDGKYAGWKHDGKPVAPEWYVYTNGRNYGPYKYPEMERLMKEQRVMPSTPVAQVGTRVWVKLADDPGLKGLSPPPSNAGTASTQPTSAARSG